MDCYDLRPWALQHDGYDYRYEESFKVETDEAVRGDGRWYVELICRRGIVYPYGGDDLLAYVSSIRLLPKLLAIDPAVSRHQVGDEEAVVRFPSRLLDRVATYLGRPAGTEIPRKHDVELPSPAQDAA